MENSNELYRRMGLRIRELRIRRGLTQDALSEACGLSSGYVGLIERGIRKPSVSTLVKIANILEAGTDCLLGDSLVFSPEDIIQRTSSFMNDLDEEHNRLVYQVVRDIHGHLRRKKE